jgi:predicted flap endonuclease-1-like 5' DNA nuclease
MTRIVDIEGIGEVYATKLTQAGVKTVAALLEIGSTPKGRKNLADKSGLSEEQILKWVNQADLFRIKGIAEEYSNLLKSSGVDTVVELARRNPTNLLEKMTVVNTEKQLVRRLPTLKMISTWIDMAECLPRKINY